MKLLEAKNIEDMTGIINIFSQKGNVSNNYLLPNELNYAVDNSNLLFCHSESNLYLFLKKPGGFLRLYYVLNNLNEIPSFETDVPIMTEILFRGNIGQPEKEIMFLQSIGFRVNLQRDQYSVMASAIEGIPPTYAPSIEETREAVALFNDSFDKLSGDFIPAEDIPQLFEQKRILCVLSENNILNGALEITIQGKNAWISHLAVNPEARRQGIADRLIKMFAQAAQDKEALRLMLWVQTQNKAATSLYAKYGFKYTNKSTISLIK